jgi:hypothetical protein
MPFMFDGAESFNQDLSMWCVENIPSEPADFATGSPLLPEYYPEWGECPTGTDVNPAAQIPERVSLAQNYPNPFNPGTEIEYALPETAEVRLEVFNMMGQRVATLVSTRQTAGNYSVRFDAGSLASGTYVYRLSAGQEIITQKMTLLK